MPINSLTPPIMTINRPQISRLNSMRCGWQERAAGTTLTIYAKRSPARPAPGFTPGSIDRRATTATPATGIQTQASRPRPPTRLWKRNGSPSPTPSQISHHSKNRCRSISRRSFFVGRPCDPSFRTERSRDQRRRFSITSSEVRSSQLSRASCAPTRRSISPRTFTTRVPGPS